MLQVSNFVEFAIQIKLYSSYFTQSGTIPFKGLEVRNGLMGIHGWLKHYSWGHFGLYRLYRSHLHTKLFLKEKIFSICLLFEKCIKNKVLENIQIQNLRNMWTIENIFEVMTAMDAFLIGFSSVLTVTLKMNVGIGVSSKNPKVPSKCMFNL